VRETTSHHAPESSQAILTITPSITLYRIVRTDPPTPRDFTSKAVLGQVDPEADAETQRREAGLSMYRTLAQARRKARAFPFLGGFISTVPIPSDAPFQVERTTASAGHHTVWGDAEALLACVVAVQPVTR
jgi:hypothetical protein